MATNTYVALDKVTVTTPVASIDLSSINQGYTDLVLVCNAKGTADLNLLLRFNGSSASDYSSTIIAASGSARTSFRFSNQTFLRGNYYGYVTTDMAAHSIIQIMNYSKTTTFKSTLHKFHNGNAGVDGTAGLWRNTAAITSITILNDNSTTFAAGSTFSLYGIKAETGDSTPKAIGGAVTSDATYWYHTFTNTGNFTPNQTLSCDYLVVAGGGGGSGGDFGNGGGGGAGGLLTGSAMSFTSGVSKAILVGAGGAGSTASAGGLGSNSILSGASTVTAFGGGGGGSYGAGGESGGCGGGGGQTGGTTTGGGGGSQGFNGGASSGIGGAGGGGMGAIGSACTSATGGNGGAGISNSLIGTATYYAGGGGGSSHNNSSTVATGGIGGGGNGGYRASGINYKPTPGTPALGGGGGGWGEYATGRGGANGGSGVIVLRYLKA
jgi:hypothetical protein